jgi:hypothetical protein
VEGVEQVYVRRPPLGFVFGRGGQVEGDSRGAGLGRAKKSTHLTKDLSLKQRTCWMGPQTEAGGIMHTAEVWALGGSAPAGLSSAAAIGPWRRRRCCSAAAARCGCRRAAARSAALPDRVAAGAIRDFSGNRTIQWLPGIESAGGRFPIRTRSTGP